MTEAIDFLRTFALVIGAVMAVSLVLSLLLLWVAARQVRHIDVPADAGFAETLHYTPFLVVLGIDLLDLALDFLAAPVAWLVLDHMGLKALRGLSVVEAVIPGTQFLPTLTAAWIGARVLGYGRPARVKELSA